MLWPGSSRPPVSVAALQLTVIWLQLAGLAVGPMGTEGGVVSARTVVDVVDVVVDDVVVVGIVVVVVEVVVVGGLVVEVVDVVVDDVVVVVLDVVVVGGLVVDVVDVVVVVVVEVVQAEVVPPTQLLRTDSLPAPSTAET